MQTQLTLVAKAVPAPTQASQVDRYLANSGTHHLTVNQPQRSRTTSRLLLRRTVSLRPNIPFKTARVERMWGEKHTEMLGQAI